MSKGIHNARTLHVHISCARQRMRAYCGGRFIATKISCFDWLINFDPVIQAMSLVKLFCWFLGSPLNNHPTVHTVLPVCV